MKLAWARAQALSVLQTAYEMPLKNPLSALDATDLRQVTAIAYETGGNAFDAAAAFMTYRIKSALEADIRLGFSSNEHDADIPKLAVGITRTRNAMMFYRAHMDAVSEIRRLRETRDGASRDSIISELR